MRDLLGGVGSAGSPESLKMFGFQNILYDFFGGVGSVRGPEPVDMYRFPHIFRWIGERGKPRIIEIVWIFKHC